MKLTIIETGLVPEPIRASFVDYPCMLRELVRASDPDMEFETVSVIKGEALPDPETLDAVLITGSPAGVYDKDPWIAPLMDFIRSAANAGIPQVGICFGHQIMAEALGGKVIKSPKGWGIGRHTYEMKACPDWAADCPTTISVGVSHQDQVVVLPPGASILAASDFTPIAAIEYSGTPAISFQFHPEFSAEYCEALYTIRKGGALSEEAVNAAIQSLAKPLDNQRLGKWIAAFIRSSHQPKR
jgi:GMP synthase-like glutamine amidotransferase